MYSHKTNHVRLKINQYFFFLQIKNPVKGSQQIIEAWLHRRESLRRCSTLKMSSTRTCIQIFVINSIRAIDSIQKASHELNMNLTPDAAAMGCIMTRALTNQHIPPPNTANPPQSLFINSS